MPIPIFGKLIPAITGQAVVDASSVELSAVGGITGATVQQAIESIATLLQASSGGEDGAHGISTIFIYRRSILPVTIAPTGGAFANGDVITPPSGWDTVVPTTTGDLYQSFARVRGGEQVGTWSAPVPAPRSPIKSMTVFRRVATSGTFPTVPPPTFSSANSFAPLVQGWVSSGALAPNQGESIYRAIVSVRVDKSVITTPAFEDATIPPDGSITDIKLATALRNRINGAKTIRYITKAYQATNGAQPGTGGFSVNASNVLVHTGTPAWLIGTQPTLTANDVEWETLVVVYTDRTLTATAAFQTNRLAPADVTGTELAAGAVSYNNLTTNMQSRTITLDGNQGKYTRVGSTGIDYVEIETGGGAPGATGPAGPAGVQGPVGPAGPTGPAGTDGTAGARGPAGPAGTDGTAGARGPAGPAGAQGGEGPRGVDGRNGAIGPAGPAGQDGDDGARGPAGPAGDDGAPGTNGTDGARGPRGDTGPQGPKGDTGPQGPIGPAGGGGGSASLNTLTTDNNPEITDFLAGSSGTSDVKFPFRPVRDRMLLDSTIALATTTSDDRFLLIKKGADGGSVSNIATVAAGSYAGGYFVGNTARYGAAFGNNAIGGTISGTSSAFFLTFIASVNAMNMLWGSTKAVASIQIGATTLTSPTTNAQTRETIASMEFASGANGRFSTQIATIIAALTAAATSNGSVPIQITFTDGTVFFRESDRLVRTPPVAATIADGSITAAKLASNAVTTPKIMDGAVTNPKIADGAISYNELNTDLKTRIGSESTETRSPVVEQFHSALSAYNEATSPGWNATTVDGITRIAAAFQTENRRTGVTTRNFFSDVLGISVAYTRIHAFYYAESDPLNTTGAPLSYLRNSSVTFTGTALGAKNLLMQMDYRILEGLSGDRNVVKVGASSGQPLLELERGVGLVFKVKREGTGTSVTVQVRDYLTPEVGAGFTTVNGEAVPAASVYPQGAPATMETENVDFEVGDIPAGSTIHITSNLWDNDNFTASDSKTITLPATFPTERTSGGTLAYDYDGHQAYTITYFFDVDSEGNPLISLQYTYTVSGYHLVWYAYRAHNETRRIPATFASEAVNFGSGYDSNGIFEPSEYDTFKQGVENPLTIELAPESGQTSATNPFMRARVAENGTQHDWVILNRRFNELQGGTARIEFGDSQLAVQKMLIGSESRLRSPTEFITLSRNITNFWGKFFMQALASGFSGSKSVKWATVIESVPITNKTFTLPSTYTDFNFVYMTGNIRGTQFFHRHFHCDIWAMDIQTQPTGHVIRIGGAGTLVKQANGSWTFDSDIQATGIIVRLIR